MTRRLVLLAALALVGAGCASSRTPVERPLPTTWEFHRPEQINVPPAPQSWTNR